MTRDAIVIASWWPTWERWIVGVAYEDEAPEAIESEYGRRYGNAHLVHYRDGRIEYGHGPSAVGRREADRHPALLARIDACHRAALAVGDLAEAERFASEHMRARSVGAQQAAGDAAEERAA